MTVRSTSFVRASNFNPAGAVLATVPANQTWIVKRVNVSNLTNGAPITAQVYASSAGGVSAAWLQVSLAVGAIGEWQGSSVLLPGDTIRVTGSGGTVTVWVDGSKLLGVSP